MPGGKIAVYTGILKVTKNKNGLAAVMGHEIAHAVAKHSVERASRSTLINVGTQIADIASGGKISGAGGGGFMLIFAKPQNQKQIKNKLNKYLHVPFGFEKHGSQIIFFQPETQDYNESNHGSL